MTYTAKGIKYLKKLCEMPCMFCEIDPGGIAHHVRLGSDKGMGMKASDKYAVPICKDCHDKCHTGRGEKYFYERHGHSVEDMIDHAFRLWRTYK